MDIKKVKVNLFDFALLLTTVFCVLKAFGFFTVSWFWVFSPLIFAVIVDLLFMMGLFTACMIVFLARAIRDLDKMKKQEDIDNV